MNEPVRTNLTLGIAIGLRFCSLAMLEMPELLGLADDTSNDFSLVAFREDLAVAVQSQVPVGPASLTAKATQRSRPSFRIRPLNQPPAVDDLLHVLCVQRT